MSRKSRSRPAALLILAGVLWTSGCAEYPADPERSLAQAREGELSVGVVEHPPWTDLSGQRPAGSEVELISSYADRIGAQIRWVPGSESELVGLMADHELDLIIGGFDENTHWASEAAPTRPYATPGDDPGRIVLVEQGENALLTDLETYFIERRTR